MRQTATLGRIIPAQNGDTPPPDEGLEAFLSETDLHVTRAPLPGPWEDLPLRDGPKRDSVERWGALGQDMRALNAKVETLAGTIKTLTYLTIGLVMVTSVLVFATLTMLTTVEADIWRLYAGMAKW